MHSMRRKESRGRIVLRLLALLSFHFFFLRPLIAQSPIDFELYNFGGFVQTRQRDHSMGALPYHGSLLLAADLDVRSEHLSAVFLRTRLVSEIFSISMHVDDERNRLLYIEPTFWFVDTTHVLRQEVALSAEIGHLGRVTTGGGLFIDQLRTMGWRASVGIPGTVRVYALEGGIVYLGEDDYRSFNVEVLDRIGIHYLEYYGFYDWAGDTFEHDELGASVLPFTLRISDLTFRSKAQTAYAWNWIEMNRVETASEGFAVSAGLDVEYGLDSEAAPEVLNMYRHDTGDSRSMIGVRIEGAHYSRSFLDVFQSRMNRLRSMSEIPEDMFNVHFTSMTEFDRSPYDATLYFRHAIAGIDGLGVTIRGRLEAVSSLFLTGYYSAIELSAPEGTKLFDRTEWTYFPELQEVIPGSKVADRIMYHYYSAGLTWLYDSNTAVSFDVCNFAFRTGTGIPNFMETDPYWQLRLSVQF
jgi:hypothetical protein